MRHLLILSLSLLFTACSAHNGSISQHISTGHQTCPEQICGVAKRPWQEVLRRNKLSSTYNHPPTYTSLTTTDRLEVIQNVYQEVMASTHYLDDETVYNRLDIYPTPLELEKAKINGIYRGDCTTFSHLFYYKLIAKGIHPSRLLRVRMDSLHRQGPATNHMAVLVDNTWLLDNNEPSKKVIRFEQSRSTPKMWLSENNVGWYMAARGNTPLQDTRFKGFSIAMF